MGSNKYHAYLRSPKWQQLKERVLERDGHRCRDCQYPYCLEVHHEHYGHLYHEERNLACLTTLCRYCHKKRHDSAPSLSELYMMVLKMGT